MKIHGAATAQQAGPLLLPAKLSWHRLAGALPRAGSGGAQQAATRPSRRPWSALAHVGIQTQPAGTAALAQAAGLSPEQQAAVFSQEKHIRQASQ